jgi:hypothetical protein
MAQAKCSCHNPPLVSIDFGSKYQGELLDTIIPLGIVLPEAETVYEHQLSTVLHLGLNPNPSEFVYGDNVKFEQLKFKITVDYCTIERFELNITADNVPLINPSVTQIMPANGNRQVSTLPCGDYFWEWDGYANLAPWTQKDEPDPNYHDEYGANVLNTRFLKRHVLSIHFKYFWANGAKSAVLFRKLIYKPQNENNDWLDVTVLGKDSHKLRLHMRPTCPDGLGEPMYNRPYRQLKAMAELGIQMHWRRNGNDTEVNLKQFPYWQPGTTQNLRDLNIKIKNQYWHMTTRADIAALENEKWHSNDILPITYDMRAYSAGPGKNIAYLGENIRIGPYKTSQEHIDLAFMETAAHEIGHNILDDCYGKDYSWAHKKTSWYPGWSRSANQADRGDAAAKAQTGKNQPIELDLMKYWINTSYTIDSYAYVKATVDDCRGAILLCKMKFALQ